MGRILAQASGGSDASAAFLSGILHDIGKLALIDRDEETYVTHLEQAEAEPNPVETEDHKFGTNHADIGRRYVTKMHLPPHLSMAVARHHTVQQDTSQLNGIVAVSNQLSKIWLEGKKGVAFESLPYAQYEQQAIDSFEAVKCNFRN